MFLDSSFVRQLINKVFQSYTFSDNGKKGSIRKMEWFISQLYEANIILTAKLKNDKRTENNMPISLMYVAIDILNKMLKKKDSVT